MHRNVEVNALEIFQNVKQKLIKTNAKKRLYTKTSTLNDNVSNYR